MRGTSVEDGLKTVESRNTDTQGGLAPLEEQPQFLPEHEPEDLLSFLRALLRYLGPGFIVTVGFIDPGNWATNIAGGSEFGYRLLWVITLSTLMLVLMQHMVARMGIVTGKSLAVNIHTRFPKWASVPLGASIVLACVATDMAEYLGAALGFQLLFGIPPVIGAPLTVLIVVIAILGQRYHRLERMILAFLAVIAVCYVVELFLVRPNWSAVAPGLIIPNLDSKSILIAMAMLGAVVMPHNIYLHSNVIQSRDWGVSDHQRRRLIRFELWDTSLAMALGWLVNGSMIIVAAAVFHRHGVLVGSIEQASETLRPLTAHITGGDFGGRLAQLMFGVALLFAGIGSSITSSLAEANVLAGFAGKPEDPHSTFYRFGLVATSIPCMIIIAMGIDSYKALIYSQVALSVQLPLTIVPLVVLARSEKVMGAFRSRGIEFALALAVSALIIGLNVLLLYQTFGGTF